MHSEEKNNIYVYFGGSGWVGLGQVGSGWVGLGQVVSGQDLSSRGGLGRGRSGCVRSCRVGPVGRFGGNCMKKGTQYRQILRLLD